MNHSRGPGVLRTIFIYELRMLLRDTRTILIAVVAPLIMFPAYILIMKYVESREEQALQEETYTYAVTGSRAPWAGRLVRAAINLDTSHPDTLRPAARFRQEAVSDPRKALEEGELHLVVEGLSSAEWDSMEAEQREEEDTSGVAAASAERPSGTDEVGIDPPRYTASHPSAPVVRILYRGESDFSREARALLLDRIGEVRILQRDSVYRAAGFPVPVQHVAELETQSVASAAKASGMFLGVAMTPFLVILMLSGGSIVAVDAISGEKERGTLETLLTTAASRTDIVRAKLLEVVVVGLVVAVINVANLLAYVVLGLLDLPASLRVDVGPLGLVLLLAQFIPIAFLVAASLLLLSGASKSYKEYQVYFFPLFLVIVVPSFAAALPGIDLRSVIALVPLAGVAVAAKEILVGDIDIPFQMLAFVSTGGLALWLTIRTEGTLSNEKLISGSDLDQADLTGGPALFPRHVLRWYLGLWVLFFLVSLWFGQDLGLRGSVIANLVVIFMGGAVVIIRRYRLDPGEVFALRMPHPAAWIAVVLGAPAALLMGIGLADLVNTFVFPVPEQIMESFGQELMGPELPLWQLVLFLSVMPGVFEELFFRGLLLHGLRKRIRRRWLLALAVGLIFGMFHVSLFRIIPTAWLGFILTWVVLFGGSIYPAMLWHALSNAIAVVPSTVGWLPEGFEPEGWWTFPAALVLLFALWVLRKTGPGER